MRFLLLCLPLLFTPSWTSADVFQEKDGLVVMEAESTDSRLGRWKLKTDVEDYQGTGHLEFTGNKPESGPAESPLEYRFQIHTPGKYQLWLRARKRLETKREDISNDCYVALSGDFESASSAPLEVLKSDTKMFGGSAEGWGWAQKLDVKHKKHDAIYELKAGETYELTISGRSQNFNIDRILLIHEKHNDGKIRRETPPESAREEAGSGFSFAKREMRDLTNKEGVTITAQLVGKTKTAVIVIVSGKRFEIPFTDLSEEDQKFLKDWEPEA